METPRENLKKHLQDNIDFEGYDNKENTILNLFKQCLDEYIHPNIVRQHNGNIPKVLSEWLRGLPSTIDMPFYTYDIVNLMKALGYDTQGMEDIEVDDLYWSELGQIIFEEGE